MSTPFRTGLCLLSPSEGSETIERALWAEQNGYESLWVPDGGGKMHALTLAAALATRTTTIRLGLGASSHAMMENWHGTPFVKPLTRVRETALVVRRMLEGEKVAFQGESLHTKGFSLKPLPPQPVPIYLAALRPKMLELAGEIADGVVLHLCPLKALPKILKHVAIGAERAGRNPADIEIVCRHNVYVTGDMAAGRDLFRKYVMGYYSAPVYNKFLAWAGFEEEAAAISAGFSTGDRAKTEGAISDEMTETLGVIGSPEKCREEVRAFVEAGIQTPVINPIAPGPDEARQTLQAFTPEQFS